MILDTDKMIANKDAGIGWMTFNNPAKRNATSLEMWKAVAVILSEFEEDDEIRVVVMKGAGDKAFVSGADISEFQKERKNANAELSYSKSAKAARYLLANMRKPLIAMIHGYCLGGGLALALNADIRIASENSQFGIPAAKLGIAPGFESLKMLVDLVGPAFAKEIMLTGRRFNSEEALRIGLVNKVLPTSILEPTVCDIAEEICSNAPLTVESSKFTINEVLKAPDKRDYEEIDRITKACFDSEDYKEGRCAFLEKRNPVFKGR